MSLILHLRVLKKVEPRKWFLHSIENSW